MKSLNYLTKIKKIFSHSSPREDRLVVLSSENTTVLFILPILFYLLFVLTFQKPWFFSGEMMAEMATNYYKSAESSNILVQLFAIDGGPIPLPQRLIALFAHLLHFPASTIPYFYNWTALLLTGIMCSSFCLKSFRILIPSDHLRCFVSLAVLLVADFETRTFINFSYFSSFLIAILSALALVDSKNEVPKWSYFIVPFGLSKASVLAVLPMVIVAFFAKGKRFRIIAGFFIFLSVIQALQLYLSHRSGVFHTDQNFTFFDKILSSVSYSIAFLSKFIVSDTYSLKLHYLVGSLILCVALFLICLRRRPSWVLILSGLLLCIGTMTLNSFALVHDWNMQGSLLRGGRYLYRHDMTFYFGVIQIVVGVLDNISVFFSFPKQRFVIPLCFFLWFIFSGWFSYAPKLNLLPDSPFLHNSQWQKMSREIDLKKPVCVPIDPLGWYYSYKCEEIGSFSPRVSRIQYSSFGRKERKQHWFFNLKPPAGQVLTHKKSLSSIAILARPGTPAPVRVFANASITLKSSGAVKHFYGDVYLNSDGGLIQMTSSQTVPVEDIKSVSVSFTAPVDLGRTFLTENSKKSVPIIAWFAVPS